VGSMQPDITPRPTVYMPQMISYIGELIDNGTAYEANNGDVYFKVESIPDYGALSGNTPEALNAGARIEVNDGKRSPLDFALWKKTEEGIRWETPWSEGRPGWHTECCVMINSIFKDQDGFIDIHGGGFDLKFPHHENEIAQSKAHNHNGLARYWLHNGFINIDEQKMSKSLGNVILAKDVVAAYGGMPFRLMVLNTHYRAPLTFTEATIEEAKTNYAKICQTVKSLEIKLQLQGIDLDSCVGDAEEAFFSELCNDLNTPNAISVLYAEIKNANQLLRVRDIDYAALSLSYGRIRDYLSTLGIRAAKTVVDEEGKALYEAYAKAKQEKDFATSDVIRGKLIDKGIF
nr:class I tRNA ligase family protein [Bacilli bacterium]